METVERNDDVERYFEIISGCVREVFFPLLCRCYFNGELSVLRLCDKFSIFILENLAYLRNDCNTEVTKFVFDRRSEFLSS